MNNSIKSWFKRVGNQLVSKLSDVTLKLPGYSSYAGKFLNVTSDGSIIASSVNPSNYSYKGAIAVAADFPDSGTPTAGDWYNVTASVTDNDPLKTNTGLSFVNGNEIYWDGSTWQDYGIISSLFSNTYFDASVGVGGDYAEPQDAFNDGKYKLIAVGNITLTQDQTINNNVLIYLCGYTITCSTYRFVYSSGTLSIEGKSGAINFAYSTDLHSLFTGSFNRENLCVKGVTITNNSTINRCYIANGGTFEKITAILPNYNISGFSNSVGSISLLVKDSIIQGGGTNCNTVFLAVTRENCHLNNVRFTGTFATGTIISGFNLSNIYGDSVGGSPQLLSCYGVNIFIDDFNVRSSILSNFICKTLSEGSGSYTNGRFVSDCSFSASNGKFINVEFNGTTTALTSTVNTRFNNCKFDGGVVIAGTANKNIISNSILSSTLEVNGTYNDISNNHITGTSTINQDYSVINGNTFTGAVTLSSGSEYNIITSNTFTGGFTDSSGATNNEIANNI